MNESTYLSKTQCERAEALMITGHVLGKHPNVSEASSVRDARSIVDLTDLAQFILTGKHPLEDWRDPADEREFTPPTNLPLED